MNERSGPEGGAYLAQHRVSPRVVAERVRQETARTHPARARLLLALRAAARAVARARRQRPPRGARQGRRRAVVLVPIGFVSDHMEVLYDLDTEAMATAERLGAPDSAGPRPPGIDPRFVAPGPRPAVERAAAERGEDVPRAAVGGRWPPWGRLRRRLLPQPAGRPARRCAGARLVT